MATFYRLIKISGVSPTWETEHKIFALEVNGCCFVITFLEEMRNSNPDEYKKLMKVLKLVGGNIRIRSPNHVKPHSKHSGIYEIIAKKGNSRISFFYDSPPKENVVCVLTYWKTSNNMKSQSSFFDKSVEIMRDYLSLS
jgi:hypothetical protein